MKSRHRWSAWTIGRLMMLLLVASILASCASTPRIRTEMDPRADLSRYSSYAFYQPVAMEEVGYTTYLTNQIRSSIRREMEERGYRYDPVSPDLRVNFQGIVRERTDVYSVPRSDIGYFYSYRARSYFAFPVWYDDTQVREYTEGTLTIDMVDAERNHLVWTGAAIGRVVQETPQERAAAADQAISLIFERFPHRSEAVR